MQADAIRTYAAALFVVCQVCGADPASAQALVFVAPGVGAAAASASGCGSAIVVPLPAALGGNAGTAAVVRPAPASAGCALSLDGIANAATFAPDAAAQAIIPASGPYGVAQQEPAFASSIVTESEADAARVESGSAALSQDAAGVAQPAAPAGPAPAPQTAARDAGGPSRPAASLLSGRFEGFTFRLSPATLYDSVLIVLVFVIVSSLAVFLTVMGIVVRNRYFTPRAVIARAAARGLKRGRFYLEYQPVFYVGIRRCYGVEVLLLWRDSVHGRRGADWFMAQLENSAVVAELLRFMLDTAAADLKATEAGRALQIIVNIPAACIADSAHVASIARFAKSLSAQRVVLQVPCEAVRYARDNLRRLQDDGVPLSLCDVRSPADAAGMVRGGLQFVKLHREIMVQAEGPRNHTLRAFSTWGREHGVPIVADGIEAVGQYHAAGRAQISLAQGFFLCKALDPGRLLTFLDRLTSKQSRHLSRDPRIA